MRAFYLLVFCIWLLAACSKSDPIINACDQTLWEMVEVSDSLQQIKLQQDSLSLRRQLTSFRYELQGLYYSLESVKVGKEDSLYWVGALYLASCYYDHSLDDMYWLHYQPNSDSSFKADESKAMLFYLKYASKLDNLKKEAWHRRLNSTNRT